MIMKGRWRKNPVHITVNDNPKCWGCGLSTSSKAWDGYKFVTFDPKKICPICGWDTVNNKQSWRK